MVSDYQITLIVITIISFIISIAFYIYFVYVPAGRAASELTTVVGQGQAAITLIEDRIETVRENTAAALTQVCTKVCQTVCLYNSTFGSGIPGCALNQQAVPAYCDPTIYNVSPGTCTCGT